MRRIVRHGLAVPAAIAARAGVTTLLLAVALVLVSTTAWSYGGADSGADAESRSKSNSKSDADSGAASLPELSPGGRVYAARCAACHGAKGEGQPRWEEPNGLGEMPAPPHDEQGHTWKHSDAMLYRIVRQGWRDPFNKTRRLTMPAFGDVLSPGETRDVIDSLKALWTPEQQRFQKTESERSPYPVEAH